MFDRGFQTPRNKRKHEAVGRVLLLFRGVWRPRSNTTHEFLIWLLKLFTLLLVIRGYCFRALISHEIMYFKNNQNVGNLLLFVVSHVVVKMAESFATNTVSRFRSPKTGEEESKLLQGSIPKSTAYKTKWAIKIFHEWQINRKVKGPVLDAGGAFKDYGDLYKVQSLCTDLANMDANALNYWLSKFVQEVANSEGKVYPARTLYGIICGIRRHLEETVGSEALNPLDA